MTVSEYNECVHTFSDNLYRFILKNIRDDEKAKDIVQDSFEKLWIKASEVSFEKSKSYLFTTGYRTMIDLIRREKKMAKFEEADERKLGVDDNYSDLGEILHEALDRLPEDQKAVVMLRDYEGYSYKEIEEITGMNQSQVKVYIYRARITLKNYLVRMDIVL